MGIYIQYNLKMTEFNRLINKKSSLINKQSCSNSELYWQKFKLLVTQKYDSKINDLQIYFSKSSPFSSEVLVISAGNNCFLNKPFSDEKNDKTFSRFSFEVFTSKLRKDGKLLAGAGADNVVKLFDTDKKELLRKLEGHRFCLFDFSSFNRINIIWILSKIICINNIWILSIIFII